MTQPLSLSSLALFPLEAVLFPEGTLGLHVFEKRYITMMRKCKDLNAPFGVVTLHAKSPARRPDGTCALFSAEGTVATIEQMQEQEDGQLSIVCRGGARFRIRQHQQIPQGVWIADVRHMPADAIVNIPQDLIATSHALATVLQTKQQPRIHSAPAPQQLQNCGWVANRWCELLPIPVSLKHSLMALENPLLRLELVAEVLEKTGITF